jgi:hypothetical protein
MSEVCKGLGLHFPRTQENSGDAASSVLSLMAMASARSRAREGRERGQVVSEREWGDRVLTYGGGRGEWTRISNARARSVHGRRVVISSSTWRATNRAKWAAIWAISGPIWTMGSKAKLQPTRHSIIFVKTTLSLELWIKR